MKVFIYELQLNIRELSLRLLHLSLLDEKNTFFSFVSVSRGWGAGILDGEGRGGRVGRVGGILADGSPR